MIVEDKCEGKRLSLFTLYEDVGDTDIESSLPLKRLWRRGNSKIRGRV